jgi:hypothetical protein
MWSSSNGNTAKVHDMPSNQLGQHAVGVCTVVPMVGSMILYASGVEVVAGVCPP